MSSTPVLFQASHNSRLPPSCAPVNLCFIMQNIRSLRKNLDHFLLHLDTFGPLPHILFLTETWLYSSEINHHNINNYNAFHHCNDEYRAGGVSVYVHDSLVSQTSTTFLKFASFDCVRVTVSMDDCYLYYF